ncbi:hypothetical protein J1C52_00195 [Roseibaca sp. Y0-43]|nr:hypothetical protein [Roseibaca sp. Y0-43]
MAQELARFDQKKQWEFCCPTCLNYYSIESKDITEEHIIPESRGGKTTTFLCKSCNSFFGGKQTRCLSDWIEINEGKAPFHQDPKKQKTTLKSGKLKISGHLSIGEQKQLIFHADKNRSNPTDYSAFSRGENISSVTITTKIPVFENEQRLRVGFLTAAYGLWFKHFGYSFVFQSIYNIVRQQIMCPDEDIASWNFLIYNDLGRSINPTLGFMRFDVDYFPVAQIYDHIVILPNSKMRHPATTSFEKVSVKALELGEPIADRLQHRSIGPAVVLCDFQEIICPDFFKNTTVPPQIIWIDGW